MWDVFISHASEDKEIVRPIVESLTKAGLTVWFDEQTLKLGDSLRRKIDEGLAKSSFGIVIVSKEFLGKEWPERELDGLFAREERGKKVILPIWHEITAEMIQERSPTLGGKLGISTAAGHEAVVKAILDAVEKKSASLVKNDEEGSILRFVDEFRSDIVSVEFAANAFKNAEKKFSIKWPTPTLLYITQLQELLSEAEMYHDSTSRFYGVKPDILSEFVGVASRTISSVMPILDNAAGRVECLLQGMSGYFGSSSIQSKEALTNYLTLANVNIIWAVVFPFHFKMLYDEFFPKRYQNWYSGKTILDHMPEVFTFQEPVYRAKVHQIGDREMQEFFWGPKSLVQSALRQSRDKGFITNSWFGKYLIPQYELLLAASGDKETVIYKEEALITKIVSDSGDEIHC